MPVGKGYFRVTKDGMRLHFTPSGRVNEAKSLSSGKVHTPAEFKADRKKASKRKAK